MHALARQRQEKKMNKARLARIAKKSLVLLVVCLALVALFVTGCSGGSAGGSADSKAQLETIAKFYKAQGNLDLPGMRAALYDPQDVAGLATATVPPEAQKAEVITKNVGNTVLITIPSQELTMTASIAKTPANAVTLAAPTGQSTTLIMKKDGSVWKIDVVETEKASAAAAGGSGGTTQP
jgi:hypothetical protein